MKSKIFLILLISSFIVSCSSSQDNSMFGDYRSAACTGVNCAGQTPNPEPSFERFDNSDVIVQKFDNTVELSGNCRLKAVADSEIQIKIISDSGATTTLTDGYMPIIGVSSTERRVAKCEKGRWAVALNGCANYLGAAGVHTVELTLKGIDKNNRYVEIQDGKITANVIRNADCDTSVQ